MKKDRGKIHLFVGGASTRASEGQKPEGVAYNVINVRARVEDIDYENRTVDLKGPRGNVITVEVDESVQNFKKTLKKVMKFRQNTRKRLLFPSGLSIRNNYSLTDFLFKKVPIIFVKGIFSDKNHDKCYYMS